jgi:penicillin-binding protein 1C
MLQSMKQGKRRPLPLRNPLNLRKAVSRPLPKSGKNLTTRPKPTGLAALFKRRKFTFTWKKLFITLGVIFGLFIVSAAAAFGFFAPQLPNPQKIQAQFVAQSTKLYDRNGKLIYNFHGDQNRTVVKSDQINPLIKQATVSVEDARFYQHHGFDPLGVLRVIRNHFTHQGLEGGGSTITQQYIKNTQNWGSDYTLSRKMKELILAIEIEQRYTKDEILTGYLNQIPYGSGAYGVEQASQTYFGKGAKDLTLSEAATLASIPQLPTYYSPYGNHLDRLFVRKNYILDRMSEVGYITKQQATEAKAATPNAATPTFKRNTDLTAPHFVFFVRERLLSILDSDPQQAEKKLDESGYKVTTSLDLDTQNLAQQIVSQMGPDTVKKYNATNASLSAVDPKTGDVLAMVGSIDYDNSKSGNTNFANALLQPGSSFKPIVYATAFGPTHTFSPASITYDVPTDFGNYKPNNYDGKFRGPITNRQALDGSLNIPAVKNLYLAGVNDSLATAKKLGISTLNQPAGDYGLSLVLGSGEVKPIEMANAYGAFANEGMINALRPILKVEKDSQIIKDFTADKPTKALEPEVAYEIANVLSDNNSRAYVFGTNNNLTLGDRPVGAKSGTTENNRDAWTIGFTPSISVAVWVGNNEANKTMTKGADGSYVAAPIWKKFMQEYLKGKPVEQFTRPGTIKDATVDKLSGKYPTDQSPPDQRVTDIFAPWQLPKDHDDVHVKVKIDKVSGKLATDLTPADSVEEKTFFSIHSEVPDNPNWENPVQDWAKANGGGIKPPTDKDDVHTDANMPTLSFVSPQDSSTVSGAFRIEVTPGGPKTITKVDFTLNGASIGTRTQAPWSVESPADLPAGTQVIQVTATNEIGLTKSAQVTVTTTTDTTAPDPVTNLKATSGKKSSSLPIKISWTSPNNPDLAVVNVYLSASNDPIDLGTKIQSTPSTPGTAQSIDVDSSGLTPNKIYYFIARPVDSKGNENQSSLKVNAILLP